MYCNVICTGERVEFHIFGGMHISGLVRAKRMGISLECSKYAYLVQLWKNQKSNVLGRKNMNINTFHSHPYKLHCKSQWNLYLAYFEKLALKPFGFFTNPTNVHCVHILVKFSCLSHFWFPRYSGCGHITC